MSAAREVTWATSLAWAASEPATVMMSATTTSGSKERISSRVGTEACTGRGDTAAAAGKHILCTKPLTAYVGPDLPRDASRRGE